MRDESEKSTTVTAPFRGLGADVGDESNPQPCNLFRIVGRGLGRFVYEVTQLFH